MMRSRAIQVKDDFNTIQNKPKTAKPKVTDVKHDGEELIINSKTTKEASTQKANPSSVPLTDLPAPKPLTFSFIHALGITAAVSIATILAIKLFRPK